MWRTVSVLFLYVPTTNSTQRSPSLSLSRRQHQQQQQQQQQLFFHFPFHPVFAGHQHTITLGTQPSPRRSIFRLLFLSFQHSSSSPLVFSFFRRPWLQEFYQLPSSLLDVHPADFISPYTLHLLLIPFLPCASQSPPFSRHAFLGIFITQLCHYSASSLNSHNLRNFCLFDTPPPSLVIFFSSCLRERGYFRNSRKPLKWNFGR